MKAERGWVCFIGHFGATTYLQEVELTSWNQLRSSWTTKCCCCQVIMWSFPNLKKLLFHAQRLWTSYSDFCEVSLCIHRQVHKTTSHNQHWWASFIISFSAGRPAQIFQLASIMLLFIVETQPAVCHVLIFIQGSIPSSLQNNGDCWRNL